MKNKLWLLQLPIVALFTAAFAIVDAGEQGRLESQWLRDSVFPSLRRISSQFTDLKFRLRGPEPPRNKIVIVEIDSDAIERLGRWPWHRDATAFLIDKVFAAGAKVVGLDMVFSEPDRRVSAELGSFLAEHQLAADAGRFETDPVLGGVIAAHADRLVLGWTTEAWCQPLYSSVDSCPVKNPDAIAAFPKGIDKFSVAGFTSPPGFDPQRTPVTSFFSFLTNLDAYNELAKRAGFFNAFPDPDGYIRRVPTLMLADGKPYPSLPVEMARIGLDEELRVTLDGAGKVERLDFARSGRPIPVTPQGVMNVNFRGPGRTFQYLSAVDVMNDDDVIQDAANRKLAGLSKKEILRDAYVLIGVTAAGTNDLRSFPFDYSVPGVEGHASVLDNLLSGDMLLPSYRSSGSLWIYLMMVVAALGFAALAQRLEAVPALLLFATVFVASAGVDVHLLFRRQMDWASGFFYLEMGCIFIFTVAAKYVLEEQNKKFIKSAFSKYVAPAIVNRIMEDPSKLMLGGEKKELTILFSDIRNFTSFSESMDAKQLATFLNDYLGIMTHLVFDNDGTLDKYIGDAIMAFWGAPLDQAAHALHSCQAAIAMMKALHENRARFKSQYGVDVAIGIGINTGVVNVGNMGSDKNFEYTVIGDHVNLASRLEGLTKYYGVAILCTRFTFDQIRAAGGEVPKHRVLDFVKVKGKQNSVELIQILDQDLSPEGMKQFEEGRRHYARQDWARAEACFKAANSLLSNAAEPDGPCEMYLERCAEFAKNPPEEGWDGSWKMTSK